MKKYKDARLVWGGREFGSECTETRMHRGDLCFFFRVCRRCV